MRFLARGTVGVLGAVAAGSGVVGVVAGSPLVALNSTGFVGGCALAATVVFYSVALERVGLASARTAAVVLVRVLAGSAAVSAVLLVVLLRQARFAAEASRFGLHSAVGMGVLAILFGALVAMVRDRD